MITKTVSKNLAIELLQSAGITINGQQPWDIQIHNEDFYSRVLQEGSLGLGESYMDEWWDCERLDQFFYRLMRAYLEEKVRNNWRLFFKSIAAKLINFQSKKRSLVVGKRHYDLGNRLFKLMLDDRMIYSCGYWKNADNLNDAQINKLELSCQKLLLKPGMRLLDIGCGFGGLARYAAENFGVEVVGITISKQQHDYAKEYCKNLPIDIRLQDYRDIHEKFDRVISIGMFEHVGQSNYRTYFSSIKQCLNENGIFLLHTIGNNTGSLVCDEWTSKYIFPNGVLPSVTQIAKASEGMMIMEDWHNFGADYDKTLMAWHHHFNQNWDQLKNEYDDRFFRMWNYYLLSCAGVFRARQLQLWQVVFSSEGLTGGYALDRHYFASRKQSEKMTLDSVLSE